MYLEKTLKEYFTNWKIDVLYFITIITIVLKLNPLTSFYDNAKLIQYFSLVDYKFSKYNAKAYEPANGNTTQCNSSSSLKYIVSAEGRTKKKGKNKNNEG